MGSPEDAAVVRSKAVLAEEQVFRLGDALILFWRSRWLICALVVICTAIAAGVVWVWPREYQAVVLISPVVDRSSDSPLGGIGGALSQLGGLASLVGVDVGAGSVDKNEALAVLESEILTARFIESRNLLPVLFSDQWDSAANRWKNPDPKAVPTLWSGTRYFQRKVRKVITNPRTGLVTMTITWKDPEQAALWANELVALTNEHMRNRAITEAQQNIAYLKEQAEKTSVVVLQKSLYGLMEAEIRKEMMARSGADFALKVLDPAVKPESQKVPRPFLWTVGGALAGFLIGLFAAAIRYARRSSLPVDSQRAG